RSAMPTVIGVDLAAGRGVTALAALDVPEDETMPPRFDRARQCEVHSDAEIIDAVASVQPAVVALDAPLTLPAAVAVALHPTLFFPSRVREESGERSNPYTRAAERDPLWGQLGLRPLPVSFLGGLAFRAIVLLPQLRARLPEAAIIEVFPSATLRLLRIRS